MKKLILILAAILVLTVLGGCGRSAVPARPEKLPGITGTAPVPEPTTEPPAASVEPETEAPAESDSLRYEPDTEDPDREFYLGDIRELLERPASAYADHVFSHQGTAKEEPSETFAAYDLAIAYGSRYIEQDLVISADGVFYCSHDLSPEALTGEPRLFSELTSRQIDELRTSDGGQRLLKLTDVFDRYGKSVTYVIELRMSLTTIRSFLQLVEEYGMQDHIIVQASYLWDLRQVEAVFPDMPKMILAFDPDTFDAALHEDCVDYICVATDRFDQESCNQVHAAGKMYCVAVLNGAGGIRKAIEMGADCYFTDYTAKALVLEELYR